MILKKRNLRYHHSSALRAIINERGIKSEIKKYIKLLQTNAFVLSKLDKMDPTLLKEFETLTWLPVRYRFNQSVN